MQLETRLVRPTDVVALASFLGRACPNQAQARNSIHRDSLTFSTLSSLLYRWSPWETPRTWVCLDSHGIQGVASIRTRCSSSIWDVDALVVPPLEGHHIALSLLGKLTDDAARVGVHKVFLRMSRDSALASVARKAGFTQYLTETLAARVHHDLSSPPSSSDACLRQRSMGDERRLFQLYNAAVPEGVRHAEAMTFREWQETRERPSILMRRKEYIYEHDGKTMGWVSVARAGRAGEFSLMTVPVEGEFTERLVNCALGLLEGKNPLYALVPEHQARVHPMLEARGFEDLEVYTRYVKQLAVRLRQPRLAPLQV